MRSGSARSTFRTRFLSIGLSIGLPALALASLVSSALAQAVPAFRNDPSPSRVDIFAGYGYFYPFTSDIANNPYPSIPYGFVGSAAGYFTKHLGVQVEGNYFPPGPQDNNCAYSAQAGPILRTQYGRVVPFFHALGGGAIVGGPAAQGCNVWGWGATGGGGVDFILPVLHDHLALRPIQADFQYAQIDNGPQILGGFRGGLGQIYAFRASAGLTLRLGSLNPMPKIAPTLDCSVQPGEPFAGDPVNVTSTSPISIAPKRHPLYRWYTSGGKIAAAGPAAAVDTTGLAPGTYQVNGQLVEGPKETPVASCIASFVVRPYEPPTVACSADKSAIHSGDTVTITSIGRSPQNRRLTYAYTASTGVIGGNDPSELLSTAGVSPGNIEVTCLVMDDRGQKASATTSIVVATPPPPPTPVIPALQSLCTINFDRDRKRPDRVDNESKACLDDVALNLNRTPEDKLLLVGTHTAGEADRDSAIRAMNAAQYLTDEKGIDPARLDLRIGPTDARSVVLLLVPPGAQVDAADTSFDTTSVKRTGEAYAKPRAKTAPRKRKAPTAPQ